MAERSGAFLILGCQRAGEEKLLLDHLHRIGANSLGWYAVHVHLSGLQAGNKQAKYIRIATQAFDAVTNNFESTH
jgi:hypothetical protein